MPFDPKLYSGDESEQDLLFGNDSQHDAALDDSCFDDSFLDDMMQELGGQLTADSNRLSQLYPGELPSLQAAIEPEFERKEVERTIAAQPNKPLTKTNPTKRVVGGGLLSLVVLLCAFVGWHAMMNTSQPGDNLPSTTALNTSTTSTEVPATTPIARAELLESSDSALVQPVQPVGLDADSATFETHEASYQDLEFLQEASEAELEAMYDIWEEDDKASFEI